MGASVQNRGWKDGPPQEGKAPKRSLLHDLRGEARLISCMGGGFEPPGRVVGIGLQPRGQADLLPRC